MVIQIIVYYFIAVSAVVILLNHWTLEIVIELILNIFCVEVVSLSSDLIEDFV